MAEVGEKHHVADAILEEHRKIREMSGRIEASRDLDELLQCLVEFRALLEQHFLTEEAPDGFYETVRIAAPRNLMTVDKMKAEHATFLSDIDRVRQRIRACLDGPMKEIFRDAGALARALRDHEGREDALLMDIIYTDLGQGDG
jgi:hemerythrin